MSTADLAYAVAAREAIFRAATRAEENKVWVSYQRWLAEHDYHERWEVGVDGHYHLVALDQQTGKTWGGA